MEAEPRVLNGDRARRANVRSVAVVGPPNTGKSTFFNRLTGASARTANWPGMTVDLLAARVLIGGSLVRLADLPGIYSLEGHSDDEALVQRFLADVPLDAIVAVLNATRIELQLPLVLALKATGVPLLVALNMADEATHLGVAIDAARLTKELGVPVVAVAAKYGHGLEEMKRALAALLDAHAGPGMADLAAVAPREAREDEAARLCALAVKMPAVLPARFTEKLDRALLHPWLGVPLFLATMFLVFQAVYGIGVPLQDGMKWLLDAAKSHLFAPALAAAPPLVRSFVLDGLVDGVGTVVTFVPLMGVFFAAMALIEDSGYLARAAWLMDALMARLGLDGRTFVMQLMGFGCNVPALMATRVLRNRATRLLSMLVIPFSLCSARLQVFLFLISAVFSRTAAPIALFALYLSSFAAAFLTALVWRRRYASHEPLMMELPPYRVPTLSMVAGEAWRATSHFLRRASGFIVAGVLAIWVLTHLPPGAAPAGPDTPAGWLAATLAPLFRPLGIDPLMSIALIFGFVAKEIVLGGLAVVLGAGSGELASALAARLDWVSATSFMVFTLIYTPCLSAIATLREEAKSLRFTVLAVAWPLSLAWLSSFAFYQAARALGF
ncbi:MAG TPA: ferrous iron transport protein B [Casimicrobiaceae bacterium]|nr:ferrous iron transport protein B [Casimicrobiaceae bacterium]